MSKEDKYIDNYISKIDKIKRLSNDYSLRNISLLEHIAVIKTQAVLILIQYVTALPNPPDHIMKHFLWDGEIDKIKRLTLVDNHVEGG